VHVIFIEPAFPRNQREFVRALHAAGAKVTGISEAPLEALDPELKHWLYKYVPIDSVCDEGTLYRIVRAIQEHEPVDRLEATIEAHIMPTARVRDACGIPGTSVRTAFLCRDKPAMKDVLREAGIATAQSRGAETLEEARDFAGTVGFPIIVKPRSAAGAAGTHRVDSLDELEHVVTRSGVGRGASVALEEFIEGHEGFFDTITIDGRITHEFISHYYPGVLEAAMRARWISPQFVATNRDVEPGYEEVKEMGRRVIDTLDIETSATHMEWFFGPKGLKFSEIGCRPPGVGAWDLYCAGNEMDIYFEWAHAIVHGRPSQTPSRRFAAGLVALRPDRDGIIADYEGIDEMQHAVGESVIDSHFPPPGTPTQSVDAGYMANAWVRLKHPDYDELRNMLDRVGMTVKVRAR
jgi:carbamoylphosphate synthase large subunit